MRTAIAAAAVAAILAAYLSPGLRARDPAAPPSLRIERDQNAPGRPRLILTGLPAQQVRAARLYLTLRTPAGKEEIPVVGRTEVQSHPARVIHQPSVPLTRGAVYRARAFWSGGTAGGLQVDYREAETPPGDGPRVTSFYPPWSLAPANLLRIHLFFDTAPEQGKIFRFLELLDERGNPVQQAFHEQELWSSDGRALTVWINPGRTKHSLGLSESLGGVLAPGRRYRLRLKRGLGDGLGRAMRADFVHSFRTGAPDRTKPSISAAYGRTPPRPGSRTPLEIETHDRIDLASARSAVEVTGSGGEPVDGEVDLIEGGSRIRFRPARKWAHGPYLLHISSKLEDLSGNSLERTFETTRKADRPAPVTGAIRIPFRVPAGESTKR